MASLVEMADWCSWKVSFLLPSCSPFWLELQYLSDAVGGTFARQQSKVLRIFCGVAFWIFCLKHAWFSRDEIWIDIWFSFSTTCRSEVSLQEDNDSFNCFSCLKKSRYLKAFEMRKSSSLWFCVIGQINPIQLSPAFTANRKNRVVNS